MTKDYKMYIEDMLESIERIESFFVHINEEQFSRDIQLQDAVIRRLGIIGEAATKLPLEIRDKAPKIPWKSIVGLRNIVIHEYTNIKLGEVWDVVQNDLPSLKKELTQLLAILK